MISRKKLANAIRILSIDAIQKANSGHPGAPMGMADIAEVLWRDFLKHNPRNPYWDNRDRFILSNGHGSMLLYSILHLSGYNISMKDLMNFRQINSHTPGHPEYNLSLGIETTTGPLGQGLGIGVGMAIAEKILSNYFNRGIYKIIDHYTWVFVGDGCLMEGISHEVCSLAGTLKLKKLIVLYDSNNISIDGNVNQWFTDDTIKRFESYNWNVIKNVNGHDYKNIIMSINKAKKSSKPCLIIFKTIIGFGSPNKSNSSEVHGSPLGDKEIMLTRKKLKWKYPSFFIPKKIYKLWDAKKKGYLLEKKWKKLFDKYQQKYPDLAKEYQRRINHELPKNWEKPINKYIYESANNLKKISTRKSSQNIIEILGNVFPELIGGSADLSPSNLTTWSGSIPITKNFSGNYIHYGVREFGMTAISNGISQHGGFIPYSSTFLMFVEYAKNAVRMSSLMKTHQIFVYTHDSIGLGEDGPTHQPIEQLSSLRLTPKLNIWRPSDQIETAIAWKTAINNKLPTAIVLSRQDLEPINRNDRQIMEIYRGGYVIKDCLSKPDIILISTGSELHVTLLSSIKLNNLGYQVRVVSMPSTDIFDKQDYEYKEYVLPKSVKKRIAVEAGISNFWYKYVGLEGYVIGIDTFGDSAPANILFKKFGFTVKNIVKKSLDILK
ncbi:transketolase [Buchnera aphidicola (Taiwanaphis decaspermi)]|uniref:transketolase n=1 Tax=Buchnera aphidicola TaxID=9 RepID=UPI0031B806D5